MKIEITKKMAMIAAGAVLVAAVLVVSVIAGRNNDDPIPVNQTAVIKGSEQKKVIENIRGMIKYVREGNGYFKVVDGENTSETYVYNSAGEAIAQGNKSNYITVFKKDSASVRYTDIVETGPDVDLLKLMDNALNLVESKDATLSKPDTPLETEKDFYVYYANIKGWDNIHKLYEGVSVEFADIMVKSMKSSVAEGKDIELRFKYVTGNNKELSAGCELIMDKAEYILWYFDGYLLLYDWALKEDWYNFDFKDTQKAEEMLAELLKELDGMFGKYAVDNNLPTKEETEAKAKADAAAAEKAKAKK